MSGRVITRPIALAGATVIAGTAIFVGSLGTASAHTRIASGRADRPTTEHVPHSLHHVSLAYRKEPFQNDSKKATVHGKRAAKLVTIFDDLAKVPANAVHCDVAGGPETTVTFHTQKHTWVAVESACTDIEVSRDGTRLPTLMPNSAWDTATSADLAD